MEQSYSRLENLFFCLLEADIFIQVLRVSQSFQFEHDLFAVLISEMGGFGSEPELDSSSLSDAPRQTDRPTLASKVTVGVLLVLLLPGSELAYHKPKNKLTLYNQNEIVDAQLVDL
jgi:hypothetical protein